MTDIEQKDIKKKTIIAPAGILDGKTYPKDICSSG